MTAKEYIDKQEPERKKLLTSIHKIIVDSDKKVKPEVDKMMGLEMIQYKCEDGNMFMYGLASSKGYMSLHLMPMYGCKPLHDKYSKLLNKAKFQKACINFTKAEQMPLNVVKNLMKDAAKIDMTPYIEHYKKVKRSREGDVKFC